MMNSKSIHFPITGLQAVTASCPVTISCLITILKELVKWKQAKQQAKRNSQPEWTGQSCIPQQAVTWIAKFPATPAVENNQCAKKAAHYFHKSYNYS